MAVTYKKPVDDDLDWQQRLSNYAGNKDAGMSEYQRALEVYRGKSAAGDTEGANAAKKWSDQVNTAIGGIGNSRTAQINNTTDTIGQKVNAAPFEFKQKASPFQYNAQADPSYQAALRQAQAGAQTATNNAMVGLGSRGIGNSSVAVDRANQIQQSSIGHVNDTILPQLMQQAYGRYQDENNNEYRNQLANYQANQDQLGNLTKYAGTLNGLNQQEIDNQYRTNQAAEQKKQSNIDLAKWGQAAYGFGAPKDDAGVFFDQYTGAKTLPFQQFEYGQAQDKLTNARADKQLDNSTRSTNASIANMSADNVRQASAEARQIGDKALSLKLDVWEKTGVAPEGIPGVTAGTPLKGSKPTVGENKNQLEAQYVSGFDGLSPDMRKKAFEENKQTIVGELGLSGYDALYKRYFDEYGDPK